MTITTSLKKAACTLTLAFMATANANAAGLTPGQCYAKADAQVVLTKEGQRPIILGDRAHTKWDAELHNIGGAEYSGIRILEMHTYLNDEQRADKYIHDLMTKKNIGYGEAFKEFKDIFNYLNLAIRQREESFLKNANVFFMNSKGYGYNIEGDAPNGTPSTKLCVRTAYKNANIRSLDMDAPPEWAKKIKSTGNGIDVAKAYQNGSRIILGAQTYTTKADGTEILGKSIVVSATPSDKGADVWAVDSTGAPNGIFSMTNIAVTNFMNQFLSQTIGQDSSAKPQ